MAPTLDGIRKDHVNRYTWAAGKLSGTVYDCGCGVGYGSKVLADAGCKVVAIERDDEAVDFARKNYYSHGTEFRQGDLSKNVEFAKADAAVAFEILEHLENPRPLLISLSRSVGLLMASVPNEDQFPYQNHAFHFRHYTRTEFEQLLNDCGWQVQAWYGQKDELAPVRPEVNGRTLIAVCVPKPPRHVVILGLGPSVNQYLDLVKRLGGRYKFSDEVWAINGLGGVLQCDMVWHMDDIRIQEIRAEARPESNIAAMLEWLKNSPVPVMTSRAYPEYPASREIPLEAMINDLTYDYFNNTAAWALAYAIHTGFERVTLFGCDYTYPDAHDAEKGRGCLEFWLGYAAAKGVKIGFPQTTTLMDACCPRHERLYGFDTRRAIFEGEQGSLTVRFEEVDELPTADEIEDRYDHSKHPNSLVAS